MKIKAQSKSRLKYPAIIAGAVVIALLGWLYYCYHYQVGPFQQSGSFEEKQVDLQKPSETQVDAGTTAKTDFEKRTTEASQERQNANGPAPTTNTSETVQTLISSSNVNGSTLSVRSIIQTIDGSGNCTITLSKTGSPDVTKTAGTNTMGSYSTCAGFDIDISALAKGDWTIKLVYTGSAGQSGTATKPVRLQ